MMWATPTPGVAMSSVVLQLPVTQVEVTGGRAVVTASVTNAGAQLQRVVLGGFPAAGGGPSAVAWTTVDQPLREIGPGATEQFTITVTPPPDTAGILASALSISSAANFELPPAR